MKTTVQVEGKAVEVDIPGVIAEADVAQKYMPKDVFETELARRGLSIAEKQGYVNPAKLDDEGKRKLAETLGIKAAESGDAAVGKQLERAKAEWAERELKPVMEKSQADKTEIAVLRRDRLSDGIVTAAAKAGVKPALLNPAIPGEKPPIVAILESAFAFDEKTRQWYAKGPSADQPFTFATAPTGAMPYKAVEEFLNDWAKLPQNKEFIGVTTQAGPGLSNTGVVSAEGIIWLTKEQAEHGATYDAALKKAGGDYSKVRVKPS